MRVKISEKARDSPAVRFAAEMFQAPASTVRRETSGETKSMRRSVKRSQRQDQRGQREDQQNLKDSELIAT